MREIEKKNTLTTLIVENMRMRDGNNHKTTTETRAKDRTDVCEGGGWETGK